MNDRPPNTVDECYEPQWFLMRFDVPVFGDMYAVSKRSWYDIVEGNMSCDCNRTRLLNTGILPCGDRIRLSRLVSLSGVEYATTYDED